MGWMQLWVGVGLRKVDHNKKGRALLGRVNYDASLCWLGEKRKEKFFQINCYYQWSTLEWENFDSFFFLARIK